MAILKNTVQVNSGNTGWTRSNVLDALEETIADLGWNSGSQVNGVVTSLAHPQNSTSVWGEFYNSGRDANWNHCGGPGITIRPISTHKYSVDDNGTGYVFQRFYTVTNWGSNYVYTSSFIPETLVTGSPLIFRTSDPSGSTPPGISNGDTVYVVRHPDYPPATDQYGIFALTATEADALAGTNILSQSGNINWRFYDPAHTDKTQLMGGINQGDTLQFWDNDDYPYAKGGSAPIAYSLTTNSGDGSDYNISGTDRSTTHTNALDPGISIYEGDTITFDNSDLAGSHPMYIRVSDGGASVSSPAATGEGTDTVSWTPTTAGTYYYQCSVAGHEGMIGTITVTSAPVGNSAITAHPLWFQDSPGAYDSTRTIDSGTNYVSILYREAPNLNYGYFGTHDTPLQWHIRGWEQDKTFYIKSQNDATYTVSFTTNPGPGRTIHQYDYVEYPYYDYTVPQDGTRSALNLRIYREDNTVPSKIAGIRVMNLNSTGWSETDTFTIPGTAVGGVSPTDDIPVGVSTDESSPGASDGTASLHVTNFGAGVNAYIKNPARNQIIFKLENDATKTYGTTYQLIELTDDHTIKFNSGSSVDFLGCDTTNEIESRSGRWGGVVGLDWSSTYGSNLNTTGTYTDVTEMDFATSSTPTAYPLKIVTYRAQSPQDTDFAIISFVQTINGVDTTYATWFYHKGNNYGNGIWDLDYVWQGGLTTIFPTTTADYAITFLTSGGHVRDGSYERNDAEGTVDQRIMREALYGYLRNPNADDSYGFTQSYWTSNMWTTSATSGQTSATTPYFRHHEYDDVVHSNLQNNDYTFYVSNQADYEAQKNKSMPAAANYYRPLKGLPIDVNLAPCPYYLPDDFVMIPFDISPGMASVRPGDTVTISGSEVYEVVRASYENNDETYDNITDNRTRGMIFAARTT